MRSVLRLYAPLAPVRLERLLRQFALYDVFHVEQKMKILSALAFTAVLLSGCISSGSPNPPAKTTIVVPEGSTTTVVCQDGSRPPC
jgi:hypothetical protein